MIKSLLKHIVIDYRYIVISVTPELAALINAYTDLSLSTYEIINNTDFTTVDINGIVYTTDLSNINFTSTVECSDGSVEHQAICGEY